MNRRYILAIDQGTTGSRAMIVDAKGKILSSAYKEFPQIYPMPGWVEHDPDVIWDTTLDVMKQAMDKAGTGGDNIKAIGITNQRETTVLWDRNTLRPIGNAIVWQCRRSSSICDDLKRQGLSPLFQEKTGLVIDAYFSATKIKWMLDNIPGARKRARTGEIAFGTIDSWLITKLTRGKVHVTDYTNASRTLIFNIHEKQWDSELLRVFDIPIEMLPRVVPSSGVVGQTDPGLLGSAIPIAGIAGDQQAALFGQACFDQGQVKNTYGTGCFMLLNLGDKKVVPKNGLLLTLACNIEGKPCYALEGSVFIAGAVVQWLRDALGLIESAPQSQEIAMLVEDTGGVYLVPAFAGLGAPYWDMYARGAITGITRSTTKAHIVRAALEGIAYQVKDLVQAFEETTGDTLTELRVDGGASRNNLLMQFQSDILGIPVERSSYIESTGMGAAFLAGLATGMWESGYDINALRTAESRFEPSITQGKRDQLYAGWLDAVERVRSGRDI